MTRVLITGMSGTGKTAVIVELGLRGYRAIDLDTSDWSHWVAADPQDDLTPGQGQDWVWREDRVRALLSSNEHAPLFISGCAENMDRLFDQIDTVVLLSAPIGTIMERLTKRTSDGYGHTPDERRRVSELIATVEPMLRLSADFEIETCGPVSNTVDEILRCIA